MSLQSIIESAGYLAVFGLVGAESIGVPLPGETALIIAGTYAGHTHHINPWLIWAVAAAGAIIGDNIGFWIGKEGGYRLARRFGSKVGLDERKLKTARYLFDRHGAKVVFFGRWVSILRTYAAFLAGTSRMKWDKFLPANAIGGLLWSGVYTFAAYYAGHALERASGTINIIIGVTAAVALIVTLYFVRHVFGKLADRAEQEYPGPLELPGCPMSCTRAWRGSARCPCARLTVALSRQARCPAFLVGNFTVFADNRAVWMGVRPARPSRGLARERVGT